MAYLVVLKEQYTNNFFHLDMICGNLRLKALDRKVPSSLRTKWHQFSGLPRRSRDLSFISQFALASTIKPMTCIMNICLSHV